MTQDFASFLTELRGMRRGWVESNRVNRFDRGIWNATVEKYPDPTHFVFELLQNAEDTGATTASFRLSADAIVFEHDGRPFDRADIEGITGMGNTTKLEDANKIGSFGIGFKSAYVVTLRPEVHCRIEGAPVAFAIEDLVVPELITPRYDDEKTRIVLPLPAATGSETIAKVLAALDASRARSLLFLKNVARLEWTDGSSTAVCTVEDHAEVRALRTMKGSSEARLDRFVLLSRDVSNEEDGRIYSVKIALLLNNGGEIVAESPSTRLAVYFETEEATGLHFHVHGPFKLTDNRANIKRNHPWNTHLVSEIAQLLAASLTGLRDKGLVKRGFLEVLPNGNDDLAEHWRPVLDAVVATFNAEALLPAQGAGHVSAPQAVRGPADIRDLLGDEGLATLEGQDGLRWIAGGMRNGRIDAFLATLQLRDWNYAEFLNAFQWMFSPAWESGAVEIKTRAKTWFDALPDDRLQRFYLLLETAAGATKRHTMLAQTPFVRLEDGTRTTPAGALIAPVDAELDEEAASHGLSLVRSALIREGRARGKEVEQFLRRLGAKDIDEEHYLKSILQANYVSGRERPTAERHLHHMRRFLKWAAETKNYAIFAGAAFLRTESAEGFSRPTSVFLDAPFVDSGLSRIYGGKVAGRDRKALWGGYAKLKRTELMSFLTALGVEHGLAVVSTRIAGNHPRWRQLSAGFGGTRTTSTRTDVDYTIPQIGGLLALRDRHVSALIWKAVSAVGEKGMYALYAPNQEYQPRQEPSTLAIALRRAEWIPAKDGSLRSPPTITGADLAKGYSRTGNELWLDAIGFGEDDRKRSQEHLARRAAAQTIGLPPELADRLERLSPEALETLGNEMLRRIESGAFAQHQFPEREAPNRERRSERLAERAQAATAKTYETRSRTVRTSDKDVKMLARPYLRDLYTNDSGEMICQACHDVMPFKLPDGSPYFEAPEVLGALSQEIAENHVALCPTCCAKWHHANDTAETVLRDAIEVSDLPEIDVTLAGSPVKLRFVRVHFDDLRTILTALKRVLA
ncbi:sacsin N-terminal ATP-binding-like domain-containing protein [Bradyrhizobium sp. HKCCYLS20291]|uniref:sacsin N-terminal ATP-binding-like domain-containing protein n=1 Tax=Bradyrhizobium sp. HKCCYLS20291 TaxID=3420766 RepID=UPI003EBF3219